MGPWALASLGGRRGQMNKQNLPGSLFVELKSSGIIVSQMNKYELFFCLPSWLDCSGGMCQWAGEVAA